MQVKKYASEGIHHDFETEGICHQKSTTRASVADLVRGMCMAGGGMRGWGFCVAGETATVADSMNSCHLLYFYMPTFLFTPNIL